MNNNNNKNFDSKNKNQFNKITPKRNFSFSKRITSYNNKRQYNNNKSKNKRFHKNAEGIKASLSFNNVNINRYSNPNITYSIENSIKDLFIKKMNDFSFRAAYQGKKTKNSNERKINYINVNNYFNPQINIIKVNKLNEAKKIIKSEKIKLKMKLKGKKNFNLINLEKLKMIQFWWKQINKIIKIQKAFRGFIFRIKLLKKLEKEEKNIYNIFILIRILQKTLVNYIFKKIKDYSYNRKLKINNYLKNNLINRKIIKSIKENDNKSIKKIEQFNNKNINVNNYNKNNNTNKIKNISIFINKKRNSNCFKSLENNSNSFNNIININKINEELRAKLKQLKNKYLFLSNKNNTNNKIASLANNINNNKILKKRKTTFKSRNIEPNSIYFSMNSKKSNNSKNLTENNQYLYLTNKNIIK